MEVRKDRAGEQEQVHIFSSGGGQEAEEGNSAAFKKIVMEKELFDGVEGLGEGSYFVHQGCQLTWAMAG